MWFTRFGWLSHRQSYHISFFYIKYKNAKVISKQAKMCSEIQQEVIYHVLWFLNFLFFNHLLAESWDSSWLYPPHVPCVCTKSGIVVIRLLLCEMLFHVLVDNIQLRAVLFNAYVFYFWGRFRVYHRKSFFNLFEGFVETPRFINYFCG